MRVGEINGEDYYFVSGREIFVDDFKEHVYFNGWFYGTSKDEFNKSNLFIMTPSGIKKLDAKDRRESFIVYLDIDEQTRRSRLSERRDADDVKRRLFADDLDFSDFYSYDIKITDPNFKAIEILEKIKSISFEILPFKSPNLLN
jgi:guanylate kinase